MSIGNPIVLIIDDDVSTIEVVAEMLRHEYEVICATEAKDGINLARGVMPDLILLDVVLPHMNGFELCNQLRNDAVTAAIPIIFVSAHGSIEQEIKGLESGAIDYVTKPLNPAILRARVRNQLELKRIRDQLELLPVTDPLTGLVNRRQFDEMVKVEFQRLARPQRELSVIMIDVDYFQVFNDTYGRLASDTCLQKVADVVLKCARRSRDLTARYGGERFVCALPDTSIEGALAVAEKIRRGVAALKIPHQTSATEKIVTVSLGVAAAKCTSHIELRDMLIIADKELYAAKQQGCNRINGG